MSSGSTASPPPLPPSHSPTVIALGGNAISPDGRHDTIYRQFAQTRRTAAAIADIVFDHAPVVFTHGNGPQVGSAVRRSELAAHEVYEVPLGVLVADLQGGMGYMIAQCIGNELERRGRPQRVTTIISTVEVAKDDPSFQTPTKPIGPFYESAEVDRLRGEGWDMTEIPGRGFRRVVPSPRPCRILEIDVIRRLVDAGELLVVVGGGGVPVVREADGLLSGREAVIDKDLASGLLARDLGASALLILTDVDGVRLDFGTSAERRLDHLTVDEARRHLDDGQFPPGSMGPKIEAAIAYLSASSIDDARAVITDLDHATDALAGTAGTTITR